MALPTFDLAVNVAFPAITAAFVLRTEEIRWIVACYVVTYAALTLGFGRLGDVIGHRRVFRAGIVASAAGFAACGVAPSYDLLLAARVAQGVGAALVLSCAPALATSFFEESRRTWALSAYGTMAAAAGVFAPLLGGTSIAWLGWSGVFWFRLPVALAALGMLAAAAPGPDAHEARSSGHYDTGGAVLLAAGLALLLLAPVLLQSAGARWSSPGAAMAGAVLLAGFALRQRRTHAPLLSGAAFGAPGFLASNGASVVVHFVAFAVPLFVPYFLARVAGLGPVGIGGLLSASPLGIMAGSVLAAPLVRRIGRRRSALAGGVMLAASQCAIGLWTEATPVAAIAFALAAHGAGIGLFQVAYTDSVLDALPQSQRGVAGSLTVLTRTLGVTGAVAALTAALGALEAPRLAAGADAAAAFLAAYREVFQGSAVACAFAFALLVWRRTALR